MEVTIETLQAICEDLQYSLNRGKKKEETPDTIGIEFSVRPMFRNGEFKIQRVRIYKNKKIVFAEDQILHKSASDTKLSDDLCFRILKQLVGEGIEALSKSGVGYSYGTWAK